MKNSNALVEWIAVEDKRTPGEWRVEAMDFDNEGKVYVTIFSGPESRQRAEEYAEWKRPRTWAYDAETKKWTQQ